MDNMHHSSGHHPAGHDMGTHNMMIVGEKAIFLSHLPMFDDPRHAFQVILEATFTSQGSDPQEIYVQDRQSHPDMKMYTLNPREEFVLSDLFTPDPHHATRSSFKATVFRGHLERGGQEIIRDIDVNIKRVLYSQNLPTGKKPRQLKYILFGRGEELFLAHLITKSPDFDQILSVKVLDRNFTDEELSQGMRVTIPDRKNSAAERIQENQQLSTEIQVVRAKALKLQMETGTDFYFEEGELQAKSTFDQTPLEKKAGF
jgi:hypothetical protein